MASRQMPGLQQNMTRRGGRFRERSIKSGGRKQGGILAEQNRRGLPLFCAVRGAKTGTVPFSETVLRFRLKTTLYGLNPSSYSGPRPLAFVKTNLHPLMRFPKSHRSFGRPRRRTADHAEIADGRREPALMASWYTCDMDSTAIPPFPAPGCEPTIHDKARARTRLARVFEQSDRFGHEHNTDPQGADATIDAAILEIRSQET